jgi:glutamyl-tRNA synthetase/glutamyl-Q tRNA(Asp) synthetase
MVVTRFAPSPTGYLHLGHVVNAIYVWGHARALGGRVVLRIEDHDRIRSRPNFEAALLEDLDWLGFVPDAGRHPLRRQSDDPSAYAEALDRLRAAYHVYSCDCSRKEIGGGPYPGTCRTRALEATVGRGVRVQMAPEEESGDLLLRDRDGNWTYQLAVTVDDIRDNVTLVIRGADLISSTARQIRLGEMLGRSTPARFLHHPLIVGPTGEKLSKSNRDTGVLELRAAGVAPADVIGRAAAAVGLVPPGTRIDAAEVARLFS